MRTLRAVFAVLALAGLAVPAAVAAAPGVPTQKKAIWGPVEVDGVSQFPIYAELGAGIWQTQVHWATVAPTRPANPADPADPAYRWPAEVDTALAEGRKHGIQVLVLLIGTPPWANGGRDDSAWAPRETRDFATFASAASKRWPGVTRWMIWGEPTRAANFKPFVAERRGKPLTAAQRRAPQRYAQLLDAAYGALKAVQRSDTVIGGNTFTTGDISPRNWVRYLRLPDGRLPRMDQWGHNPFTGRKPDLAKPPLPAGFADFSDLDTMVGWLDRWQRKGRPRPLRLFLSEFAIPTDHANYEFNFYVSRATQATWLSAALRIARRMPRVATLGWFQLYDQADSPKGDEVRNGLMTADGVRKPSFAAFARG